MDAKLTTQRRVFISAYARYQAADRAWTVALTSAADFVPDVAGHGVWRLGSAHSKLRRLYMERDRALNRLMVARRKLAVAKARLSGGRNRQSDLVFLIGQ